MTEQMTDTDEFKKINMYIENAIKKLGGKIINISYILSEGIVTEAYGCYEFPQLGVITTSFILDNRKI